MKYNKLLVLISIVCLMSFSLYSGCRRIGYRATCARRCGPCLRPYPNFYGPYPVTGWNPYFFYGAPYAYPYSYYYPTPGFSFGFNVNL